MAGRPFHLEKSTAAYGALAVEGGGRGAGRRGEGKCVYERKRDHPRNASLIPRARDIYRMHARPRTRVSDGRSASWSSSRRGKRITVLLCSRGMTRTECSNFAQYRRNTGRFGNADQHFPSRPLFLSLSLCLSVSCSLGLPISPVHRLDISSTVFSFRNVTYRNNPSRNLSFCPHRANFHVRTAYSSQCLN